MHTNIVGNNPLEWTGSAAFAPSPPLSALRCPPSQKCWLKLNISVNSGGRRSSRSSISATPHGAINAAAGAPESYSNIRRKNRPRVSSEGGGVGSHGGQGGRGATSRPATPAPLRSAVPHTIVVGDATTAALSNIQDGAQEASPLPPRSIGDTARLEAERAGNPAAYASVFAGVVSRRSDDAVGVENSRGTVGGGGRASREAPAQEVTGRQKTGAERCALNDNRGNCLGCSVARQACWLFGVGMERCSSCRPRQNTPSCSLMLYTCFMFYSVF